MKLKIVKLSAVFLLLLFMGESCQKDVWKEIELSDNTCGDEVGILNTIIDYSGTISMVARTEVYLIIVNDPENSTELHFFACNLPVQYYQNGLKIIFSGEVLNIKDWVEGEADFIGTPIRITNAKIQEK